MFVSILGGAWLENHFSCLLSLLMVWVSHARVTQYPADAVSCRCCVSFILRATVGTLLGEKAQIAAAKEICQLISKQKRVVGKKLGQGWIFRFRWILSCHFLIVSLCSCQMLLFMRGTWRHVWALRKSQLVSMCLCVHSLSWAVCYRTWAPLPPHCCRTPA